MKCLTNINVHASWLSTKLSYLISTEDISYFNFMRLLTFNILNTQSNSESGSGVSKSPMNIKILLKHCTASFDISEEGNLSKEFSSGTFAKKLSSIQYSAYTYHQGVWGMSQTPCPKRQ